MGFDLGSIFGPPTVGSITSGSITGGTTGGGGIKNFFSGLGGSILGLVNGTKQIDLSKAIKLPTATVDAGGETQKLIKMAMVALLAFGVMTMMSKRN